MSYSGGHFGNSFLAEQLVQKRRPQAGELTNYLDWAHYKRVCAQHRAASDRARAKGERPPPPPSPPRVRVLIP